MSRAAKLLLTFQSIHQVLAAEQALKAAGLSPDLVPVPKEISADCGMAITLAPGDRACALSALQRVPPTRVLDGWEP